MSAEVSSKKSKTSRTPEEQAARDARKAAKLAAATVSPIADDAMVADEPVHAESSAAAARSASPSAADESSRKKLKRRRNSKGEDEVEQVDDGTLLEIDVDAPEPLSKAEARAAKKRAKKGLPDLPPKISSNTKDVKGKKREDGAEGGEEGEEEVKKKEKPAQRQNSIWVGNLAYKTTGETLQAFFEKGLLGQGGNPVGAVTRVKLPMKPGKGAFAPTNRGFAYVDFASPELQNMAVALSESFFEGRKLLIKRGDDHTVLPNALTPRPEKLKPGTDAYGILKRQQHPESSTLFMGNLPFDATEEGLRDYIELNADEKAEADLKQEQEDKAEQGESGEGGEEKKADVPERVDPRGGKKSGLRKVRLGAFEDTGRCKGFAFLDFHSPQEATKTLVNRKNHFFSGRKLNLQYASESATKRSGTERVKGAENADPNRPKRDKPTARPARPARPTTDSETHQGYVDVQPAATEEYDQDAEYAEPKQSWGGGDKRDERGKKWQSAGRPRPGAALAMAKREKVGIVKAEGAKIVFD